jgi:hypothetical protein
MMEPLSPWVLSAPLSSSLCQHRVSSLKPSSSSYLDMSHSPQKLLLPTRDDNDIGALFRELTRDGQAHAR